MKPTTSCTATAVNNSSTDYLYNPATVASVYDPANGLNQYPKVDTMTFTYRTDGPMTYDGVRYFAYDERRNLTLARQGVLTAGNYEQDLYDALGARFYSARAATTIADTRRVELTDGLRPEMAVTPTSWGECNKVTVTCGKSGRGAMRRIKSTFA